jgi:tetratricopeptide (TPR) repeat protein
VIVSHLVPHLGATTIDRSVAQPFDEAFDAVQDVDWWIRTTEHCRVATIPRFGYLIRRHEAPRNRNDLEARIRCTQLLLEKHADYFAAHRRAAAFRWKRLGLYLVRGEDYDQALECFARSFRLAPDARSLVHLARTFARRVRSRRSYTSAGV